jgi:hypothetical protein
MEGSEGTRKSRKMRYLESGGWRAKIGEKWTKRHGDIRLAELERGVRWVAETG